MVLKDPLLVFQFDEIHQTGLIWAVRRKDLLMTRYLLKNYSRVNFKDLMGRTALNFAVADCEEKLVNTLICFKADPCSENNKGEKITELIKPHENSEVEIEFALGLAEE